jgi:excisionase family DNA binding protein
MWKTHHHVRGENMTDEDERGWLTPAEVRDMFQVHPATVIRWANKGALPFIRTPGGHRRYSRAAIERILTGDE